jgi:NTE family protein
MASDQHKVGLSLSGGGYRASAFHLGTLKKLHELGILRRVDILSTISGGSITGACYSLENEKPFEEFEQRLYTGLQQKNVITRVLLSLTFLQLILIVLVFLAPGIYFLFTPYAWMFPILLAILVFLLMKFQFEIFPVSKRIEQIYDDFFYHKKTLGELSEKPLLVIGSTNLETARPFTFSKTWMQDSTYQYLPDPVKFKAEKFPVSRAVMASSCVPFAFTPIRIAKQFFANPEDSHRVDPLLVDGGVYDNQGIHKIMQQGRYACQYVITSDAGSGSHGKLSLRNTISLLITTVDVFMARIKKTQMVQDIYDNTKLGNKQIAYLSLAWDIENCIPGFVRNLIDNHIPESVIKAHDIPASWLPDPKAHQSEIIQYLKDVTGYEQIAKPTPAELKIARTVGTNLTALSKSQVDSLMKQAACLTELQVKLYCPSLIPTS